jgi:hypothetical protein
LLFILFTVFRDFQVGADTLAYKRRFENADNIPYLKSLKNQGNEPGYGTLVWIVRALTPDFRILLFICFSFIFISQLSLIKKIQFSFFTAFVYFVFVFTLILQSLCLLRNILAVCIALYAFFFLVNKKYFSALVLTLIAVTFHFSAAICLPVYFMSRFFAKKYFSVKKIIYFTIFAFLAILILSFIIKQIITAHFGRYAHYVVGASNYVGTGLTINTFLFYFLIAVLCILKWNKLVKHNEHNQIMFAVLMTGFLILPLELIVSAFYRMLFFIQPAAFFLISEVFSVSKITRKTMFLNLLIRCTLLLAMFYYLYSFFAKIFSAYGLTHYSNILF